MLSDREDMDYGRYRDTVSDYLTERDYLAGRYDSERDFDYSKYSSDRGLAYDEYSADRGLSYDQYRAGIADEQWEKEYLLALDKWNTEKAALSASNNPNNNNNNNIDNNNNKQPQNEPVDTPKYTYEETPAVRNFAAKIRTSSEFARGSNSDNKTYKTYKDYVRGMLNKYEADLSDNDIATIAQMFGL
jgi:hypothetical protein